MRFNIGVAATLGALTCFGQASAQTADPATPAQAAAPGAATDAEVQGFARATLKLHGMTQPTPEQMREAISGAGLSVERYNAIAELMQKDPAFQTRVNSAMIRAQQEAQPAAAKAAASAPLPPLPTTGLGASVLTVLDNVCLPMVRQDRPLSEIGVRAGLKLNKRDGTYTTALGQVPHGLSVIPRGANQNVCRVQIRHPLGSGDEIAKALNIWSMHQKPEMKMVRNDAGAGADGLKRTTLSWERSEGGRIAGLVFVRVERPDGAPVEKDVGSATLLYSERSS